MLIDDYDLFRECCIRLGLSADDMDKIYALKKLRVLNSDLDESSLSFAESQEILSEVTVPKGMCLLVKKEHFFEGYLNIIPVDDPRLVFWSLYELVERTKNISSPSLISDNCKVGRGTNISNTGVIIEDDVVIGDNVVIEPGVIIKKGAKIGSGCVLGSTGLEVKDTIFGRIVLSHRAGVIIEENVELGALCTVNQGLGDAATKICLDTKIDSGVHIAHSCLIGPRNIIAANATFGGSVVTGENVFFGLNSTMKNGIKLADGCFVGASSFVSESYEFSVRLIPRSAKPLKI